MNLKYIHLKSFFVFITLALIGLIFIQIYWVKHAFELNEIEFNSEARKAIDEAVLKYEKSEMFYRIKNSQLASKVLISSEIGSSFKKNIVVDRDTAVLKDGDGYKVRVTEYNYVDTNSGVKSISLVKEFKKNSNEIVYTENENIVLDINASDTAINDYFDYGKEQYSFQNQAMLINDIIGQFRNNNKNISISDRLDIKLLDTLLREQFSLHGIHLGYHFVILDNMNKVLLNSSESSLNTDFDDQYLHNLYPNDILPSQYFISVRFLSLKTFLIKQSWLMIVLSIVLILIISYAFYYSLTRILKAEKLRVIKNDFINNMTHELKTPIATISLATEALSDPSLNCMENSRNRFLNIINQENTRLKVLVDNVLQSAILEEGTLTLYREDIDLNKILVSIYDSESIKVNKLNGQISYNTNKTPVIFNGDMIHLTNVFYNLLDNAIKYSPEDRVDINIELLDKGSNIEILFKDKGIGVAKENQYHIFEKLFRVPEGDLHNVKGFGLGLSYAKSIIDLHGGSIHVSSQFNIGSTFKIVLPKKSKI